MPSSITQVERAHVGWTPALEPVRSGGSARSGAPLLEPAPEGPAEHFAKYDGASHPVRVFLVSALVGYALLVGLTIAAGFLLTKVVLQMGSVAGWDAHISRWLVTTRTPWRVDLSWIGSTLAG